MAEESKGSRGGRRGGQQAIPSANDEEEEAESQSLRSSSSNPDVMKIADAALASSSSTYTHTHRHTTSGQPSEWQPMETTTTLDIAAQQAKAWWHQAGAKTTEYLDAAAALFAERRQLVLALVALLLVAGVLLNFFDQDGSGGSTNGNNASSSSSSSSSSSPPSLLHHTTTSKDLPTDLRRRIQTTRLKALRKGKMGLGGTFAYDPVLQPLATTQEIVRDHHVDFILSQIQPEALKAKKASQALAPPSSFSSSSFDPFAEGSREKLLTVGDFGEGHVLMLNKFPTMKDHLLLVTKEFQPQEGLLRGEDLYAWWKLVRDVPAVGFFNSGPEAGASQGHRHMQAVPLDVLRSFNLMGTYHVPLDVLVEEFLSAAPQGKSFRLPSLPFPHRMFLLPETGTRGLGGGGRRGRGGKQGTKEEMTAQELEGLYHRLLKRIGVDVHGMSAVEVGGGVGVGVRGANRAAVEGKRGGIRAAGSVVGGNDAEGELSRSRPPSHSAAVLGYNLVLTDRWFLAVPRTQSSYLGIEVNGMGFFGALLAQDKETADVIKRVGPINILKGVVPPHV